MPSVTDYIMAWSIYLLSASALMITGWRLTSRLWHWLKDSLRVISAVLLLTPALIDGGDQHLAPAIFVIAFELVSAPDGGTGPLLGVRLLLITIMAVLGVWLLRLLWYWLVARGRQKETVRQVPSPVPPRGRSRDAGPTHSVGG